MAGQRNPSYGKADRAMTLKIHKALEEALIKLPDGMVEYKEGFSDRSVADFLHCSPNSVAGHRQDIFGHLKRAQSDPKAELKTLREDHETLKRRFDELADKHNKLATAISLARIGTDVRHLTVGIHPPQNAAEAAYKAGVK